MTAASARNQLPAADAALEELDSAATPPEVGEDALAAAFTARHSEQLRYTAGWTRWHAWTGVRWEEDRTLDVYDRVRRFCREVATDLKPRAAATITSAKTVAAVEKFARADRVHAMTVEQWDADPWLLNTPSGVVDLRTGRVRAATPGDYLTKLTGAGPGEGSPRWAAFIDRVTGGDTELGSFLQRIAGYCLTGVTHAHALFFLYGTGGNGKGVFINTLTHLLGDYARVAPAETFTASRTDRHPTELAMLRGARLVASQETEEGRRWAESKIKAITGGDPIPARFMRADFFEYVPQFKLIIAGNHKPHLRSVDEAMRRRLHLVPFTQTIRPDERIEGLEEQLRAEWPGILSWAIEGCLAWQRDGLNPPTIAQEATEDYFAGEDSFQTWLDECCERGPGYRDTAGHLFTSWKEWCERTREEPGTQKAFSTLLRDRGFASEKDKTRNRTRMYAGLRVTPDQPHLSEALDVAS